MTSAPESYAVPALTRVADAEALQAWFDGAEPGARVLVAEGRVKPVASLGWMVADGWRRLGQVTIDSERDGAATRWIAVRCGVGGEGVSTSLDTNGNQGRRGGAAAEPNAPDGTPVSDHILRTIRRHANMGLPAPSLATLAKGAGLNSPANAKYYVGKLERRGAIEIEVRTVAGVGERRRFHSLDSEGRRVKSSGWSR